MKNIMISLFLITLFWGASILAYAESRAPWGTAEIKNSEYSPEKVLYDMTTGDKKHLIRLLDRIIYLNTLYGSDTFNASIVVVIHGEAIPFFALNTYKENSELMQRAQSMTVGTAIEFRMCRASAKLLNYEAADIHGFVTMVPMADAEIIRLEHDGYAYMR